MTATLGRPITPQRVLSYPDTARRLPESCFSPHPGIFPRKPREIQSCPTLAHMLLPKPSVGTNLAYSGHTRPSLRPFGPHVALVGLGQIWSDFSPTSTTVRRAWSQFGQTWQRNGHCSSLGKLKATWANFGKSGKDCRSKFEHMLGNSGFRLSSPRNRPGTAEKQHSGNFTFSTFGGTWSDISSISKSMPPVAMRVEAQMPSPVDAHPIEASSQQMQSPTSIVPAAARVRGNSVGTQDSRYQVDPNMSATRSSRIRWTMGETRVRGPPGGGPSPSGACRRCPRPLSL